MLQKALKFTFASFGYYSEQYPCMQSWLGYYSLHSTRTLCRVTIPEKQGDKTLFINSDQFTPTVPQTES